MCRFMVGDLDIVGVDVGEGVRTPDWAKNMLAGIPEQLSRAKYEILDEILKEKNRLMKEKKTKKMTKAEAFEWLKGKKIKCICAVAYEDAQANKVEKFLKDVGCKYHYANHISWRDWYWPLYGFIVDENGKIYAAFENQMDFFIQSPNEYIRVDDILSIEIVDEKNGEEDALDLISTVGARLSGVLRRMEGHKHIVITEDDVIVYDEGMSLFHSDPF